MWTYMKMLEYPVNIKTTDAKLAMAIMSQLGGPNGEKGAATRYLSQRYAMPNNKVIGALTDIGTEELGHEEMIATIVTQLTKNLTMDEIEKSGFYQYYVDHTTGIWPQNAAGVPFSTASLQSTGDPIADLHEDMAAEQKARITYDNILRLCKDNPDVYDAIKFLRAREMVHFQRFGESLRLIQDDLDSKNFYAFNPAFDKKATCL
ncbi:MAG: manganese catalase family protein [Lachnospiraceae bacterium]